MNTIDNSMKSFKSKVTYIIEEYLEKTSEMPVNNDIVSIGGQEYYADTLLAAAREMSKRYNASNLAEFVVGYPGIAKVREVPKKDKTEYTPIIQGDDPRPAFKYMGVYYSQYFLERAKELNMTPEKFANEYPSTSKSYRVEYNG